MSDLDLTQVFEEDWEALNIHWKFKIWKKACFRSVAIVNKCLREMYACIMQITAIMNCDGDMVSHTEPFFIYLV
jgi:hypothetical protein